MTSSAKLIFGCAAQASCAAGKTPSPISDVIATAAPAANRDLPIADMTASPSNVPPSRPLCAPDNITCDGRKGTCAVGGPTSPCRMGTRLARRALDPYQGPARETRGVSRYPPPKRRERPEAAPGTRPLAMRCVASPGEPDRPRDHVHVVVRIVERHPGHIAGAVGDIEHV